MPDPTPIQRASAIICHGDGNPVCDEHRLAARLVLASIDRDQLARVLMDLGPTIADGITWDTPGDCRDGEHEMIRDAYRADADAVLAWLTREA